MVLVTVFDNTFVPKPKRRYGSDVITVLSDELLAKLNANSAILKILPIGTKVRISNYLGDKTTSKDGSNINTSMLDKRDEWIEIIGYYNHTETKNDAFKVHYKLKDCPKTSWTIDMFDAFSLPRYFEVTGTNITIPVLDRLSGTGIINNTRLMINDNYPYYRFSNKSGCYTNWSIKNLALLNLAIDNGASYDKLEWL
jgi:hypothetical protein